MTHLRNFLKHQSLRYLPPAVLQRLKMYHYARSLRSATYDDEPDLAIVRHLATPGSTVLDLGANVGLYTKALSEFVGPTGRVVSVEPIPPTFAILTSNVRALRLVNVTTVNAAVSDAEATVTMSVPNYGEGGGNFYQARIVGDTVTTAEGTSYRVPARPVDAVIARGTSVSFVKCDVENHEEACLAGSVALIRDQHPAWLIEVWGDPDDATSSAARVFATLADQSYSAWFYANGRLHRRMRGDRATNYFFLDDAHLATLHRCAPLLVA